MDLYPFFKFMAFKMDAEKAHEGSFKLLSKFPLSCSEVFGQADIRPELSVNFKQTKYGKPMKWPFPVGLAAGLDKNAEAIAFFSRLLFGAIEVGTVTPKPQIGNPRPRLFRIPEEESLLNRMGFNNEGAEKILENILSQQGLCDLKPLGINLGKNKDTPQDKAVDDYKYLYSKFASSCDYLVINVSSPNTPGLRDLQNESYLRELFSELQKHREENPCRLYIKLSPDMSFEDIPGIIAVVSEYELAGVIATNTTIMKERGEGGVSGRLLSQKAREFRNKVLEVSKDDSNLDVIGVGGMSSYEDLIDFWRHGGRAAQIYSAFIYQGPKFLAKIKEKILNDFDSKKVSNLEELIELYRNDGL